MTEVKRTLVVIGNLEIDFNPRLNQITVHKADRMPHMDMQAVPEDATLFWGTAKQFEEFLERAHKKFGHLYTPEKMEGGQGKEKNKWDAGTGLA